MQFLGAGIGTIQLVDKKDAPANEGKDVFHMNRRGYRYGAADENKVADLKSVSERTF